RNHDDKTQQDETNKLNDAIDLICEALKTNSLSIEQEMKLFSSFSENIKIKCKNDDILRTLLFNTTPRALATLDVATFLKYIPNSISSFLRQLLNNNDDLNTIDDNTAQRINYRTCKIYELIYSGVNGLCIMPFSFTESLMIHTLTGSKLASTILSQTQSSGSYKTINRWYRKYGKIENEVPD
ncbi:unnamed protein product, partial [Didymodactylos carnosus]